MALWLVPESQNVVSDISKHMEKHHFQSVIMSNFSDVSKYLTHNRVPLIIICESQQLAETEKNIISLTSLPEAKGSRFVFTYNKQNHELLETVTAQNIRELIPLNIPINFWVYRALYASSSHAMKYPIAPNRITFNHSVELAFPGKVIWINQNKLRLECQLDLPVGSSVHVKGKLFEDEKHESIKLVVKKVEHRRLYYRFSSVIEGTWSKQDQSNPSTRSMMENIKENIEHTLNPKYRIFVALKDPDLRTKILNFFDFDHFDCNSALHLKSIIYEPKFYTPDLVVIEDKLCAQNQKNAFQKMLRFIPSKTPIIIMGDSENFEAIQSEHKERKIFSLKSYSFAKLSEIVGKSLPELEELVDSHPETYYLDGKSKEACVTLKLPGKIQSLHPQNATISSKFQIKNFTILEIRSPLIKSLCKNYPFMKITKMNEASFGPPDSTHFYSGYLMNVDFEEQKSFANSLCKYLAKSLLIEHDEFLNEGIKKVSNQRDSSQAKVSSEALEAPKSLEIRENYSKIHTRKSKRQQKTPPKIYKIFKVIGVIFVIVWVSFDFSQYILPLLIQNYRKSGSVYSEQFKMFKKTTHTDEQK